MTARPASIGAAFSALAALACCIPLGFPAALGLLGLSAVPTVWQRWLLSGSVALLAISFAQLYMGHRRCQRTSKSSLLLFGISAAIVITVVVFPQMAAALLMFLS